MISNDFKKKCIKYSKVLIALGLGIGFLVLVYLIILSSNLPDVSVLKNYSPALSSRIYSADDEVLLEIGKEKRELVELEKIPKVLINAFLSAEDNNFYNHSGVDFLGVIRATLANIRAGRVVQGGSTITQQVAKSLLLTSERSIQRKLKDFLLALKIERKFSKKEILYLYLNQVYLGGGFYGVKAAARGYFDKKLEEVSIAEAALLAGLLVAPGRYSPYLNPKYAKKRQSYVLDRLFANEKISQDEFEKAKIEAIKLVKKGQSEFKAPYFTDWVRQKVIELVGEDEFLTQGFEVRTTLNWKLQKEAQKAISKGTRELDKRQGFNGPIEKIEKENIIPKIIELRREILKEASSFTYFNAQGELLDERDLQDSEIEELKNKVSSKFSKDSDLSKVSKVSAFEGNSEDTQVVINGLETDKDYKALVIGTHRLQKVIFVDIGGIRLVIPREFYKWARKRDISEKPIYYTDIENPRKVVKTGDIVWIRIKDKKPRALKSLVSADYLKLSLRRKTRSYLAENNFYTAILEQPAKVQSSLLAMNPFNGNIISMVGGTNFSESQFNRSVQAKRQPGSAFKPFIFATALENGFTASSILYDTPQALAGFDQMSDWKPRNYDGKFLGPLTLRKCLEGSRNVPTITLLQRLGVDKVKGFLKRNNFILQREIDLSIALGSFGASLLDLVSLYSIFPNGGERIQYKSIVSIKNSSGEEFLYNEHQETNNLDVDETEKEFKTKVKNAAVKKEVLKDEEKEKLNIPLIDFTSGLSANQVLDKRLSFIMSDMLRGVITRGTGKAASSISNNIGGKTGTTNNYVDAWFVGFSAELVVGVWSGFDDNSTLGYGETGAKAALPIWKDYMAKNLKINSDKSLKVPKGIVNILIDPKSGKKIQNEITDTALREYFVSGTEPGGEFDQDKKYDDLGIIDGDDYYSSQED